MSKFFIRRPIFAIVISLIIVLLGLISLSTLPIAQYPQISPPTIRLSANYTGANASIVNQTVAQVIEDQLNGVENMDYMSLTSILTGIRIPSMYRTVPIWPRTACLPRSSRRALLSGKHPAIWC